MNDDYRESAEYIDIMSRDAWQELGPLLAVALTGVAGTVVDLGAGSGLGTLLIAKALPRAEIIAVEDDLRAETAEFGFTVRPVGPTAASLYAMTGPFSPPSGPDR